MDESEAEKIAEKILAIDPEIGVAGVIDEKGDLIGGKVGKSSGSRMSRNKKDWESIVSRAAVIMGAVRASDENFSETESIVFIRKNQKELLTWIPKDRVIIAAIFPKNIDGWMLSRKIRGLFGLE